LVIKPAAAGHGGAVGEAQAVQQPAGVSLATLFSTHYDFVWRSLRRLGVEGGSADDAAQEVFMVAAKKLDRILPGAERAFLFGTALRVASDARRARSRRRESAEGSEVIEAAWAGGPSLDELVERKQARELLDLALDSMPLDVRAVFTLFELEGLTMAEIAACTDTPPGTVASRLRRGRDIFEAFLKRAHARAEKR